MTAPMLAKPAHGRPCNGCGRCCHDELCPLGARLFGRWHGPCPALQPAEGQSLVCGLVADPARHQPVRTLAHGREAMSKAAAVLIGAGFGCDAQTADEPADAEFRACMRREFAARRSEARAAAAIFGIAL